MNHPNARLGIPVCGIAARDDGKCARPAPIMAIFMYRPRLPSCRRRHSRTASLSLALNMGSFVSSFQSMISMTSIDHANLSRLDLNLLVAFDALLTERSVTRAAARIGLGQSAMSHNLARLGRCLATSC